MNDKRKELFQKQQYAIEQYTNKLIPYIKTDLVMMANTGKKSCIVYSENCFNPIDNTKIPLIYYIYGPSIGGLEYLKNNNVNSLIEELNVYFKKELYKFTILQTDKNIIDIEVEIL